MDILTIAGLGKAFGSQSVLDDLSFSVPEGSIYGFIGKNGSGKTTTMKIVLGLLPADAGEISVCGEKVHYGDTRTNRFIGYLPDVPEFYGLHDRKGNEAQGCAATSQACRPRLFKPNPRNCWNWSDWRM